MTEMTPAQLTHEVDRLTEEVRQMKNLLALFMVNGLADAFDGTGNQAFGGGVMQLNKSGMQVKSVGTTPLGALYWVENMFPGSAPAVPGVEMAGYGTTAGGAADGWVRLTASADISNPINTTYAAILRMIGGQGNSNYGSIDLEINRSGAWGGLHVYHDASLSYVSVDFFPFWLAVRTTDPTTTLSDGMLWYRSDLFRPRIRSNGITGNLGIEIQSAAAAAVATGGTITTAGVSAARVSPAGAVTGVILAVGTTGGQMCQVVNEAIAANTVTFAAAATSNVADGVGSVIAGLTARSFVWDSVTALWYPCK